MSKDALRAAMPTIAAIVDELRPLMKTGGKVVFASENGHVIDRRESVNLESVFQIPANYAPCRAVQKKDKR